ncbi:MAG: MATE family efflux transporter [Armatimonadota bacterium]|nr:MATE family efflux transporter [Armatimonadota bacterium]MDR7443222.1 MATE family efflux transporter [Armatimonadota bacterium]MDR7563726.1 MATE family efflux transporter [Armatimonadota bacterium]MDR7568570.1 MATE family efflux transporter [Armatimonadota bacterium]
MPLWRNSVVNIAGQAVPAAAYALVLPSLIYALGLVRFGVFALVWTLFSYLTFFDLGLARGAARAAAQAHALGNHHLLPRILWTSCLLLTTVGGVVGITLWMAAPTGVTWLRLSPEIRVEAMNAFHLTGLVLPVFLAAWALQAVLEGLRWFGPLAVARGALGIVTAVGLAATARIGLAAMIMAMAGTRALYLVALAWTAGRAMPRVWTNPWFDGRVARELVEFSRWIVVHAWMAPLLAYGDRFLVAVLRGAADVSLYTVPQETVLRLMLLPAAVATAAYPALSGGQAVGDMRIVRRTYAEGVRLVSAVLGPCALLLVLFPGEILHLWIGPQARASADPLRLLALGGFLFGCAHVPSVAFTALGRPDVPARVTLALALPFLVAAAFLIRIQGAIGAALAWSLRAGVQFGAYMILLGGILGSNEPLGSRDTRGSVIRWILALGLAAAMDAVLHPPLEIRIGLVGVVVAMWAYRWVAAKLASRVALEEGEGCVGSVRSRS